MSLDLILLLTFSTPIALAAIGETVSQRAGVLNIGLEGMMLCGAFFGMLVSLDTGSPWLGMGAAGLSSLALALASSLFIVRLAADQVVVGTAINLLALGLTGTLFRARFGQSGALLSVAKLPEWNGLDPVAVSMLASVPLVWWVLQRTGFGLALRAAGESTKAVEAAGFSVAVLRTACLSISGLFGGLAGGYLALGIAGSFAENMTAGRGFVAIALVTFGRWKPGWVLAAALLIGFAESLQFSLQADNVGLPHQLFVALPYVVALLVLVVAGKGTQAPDSLGVAYRRET